MADETRPIRWRNAAVGALARHDCFAQGTLADCLHRITEAAAEVLALDEAGIWLLRDGAADLDCVDLDCADLYDARTGRHGTGAAMDAARHAACLDALRTERPAAGRAGVAGSVIAMPVFHAGRIAGVLHCTDRGRSRDWREDEGTLAASLADLVALALAEDARRTAEAGRSLIERRLQVAMDVTRSAIWDLDLVTGDVWWSAEYFAMLGLDACAVRPDDGTWASLIHPGDRAQVIGQAKAHRSGDGTFLRQTYRMLRADGGVVWVEDAGYLVRDAAGRPTRWTGVKSDVTERIRTAASAHRTEASYRSRLAHATMHDALTGLPNRHLFMERLGRALGRDGAAGPAGVAVILADFDNLKLINDSLGHAIGDAMVVEQSHRLLERLRPGDTLARLGGDEFAMLVEGIGSPSAALELADALRAALCVPVGLEGQDVHTSACLGVAFDEAAVAAPEDLLRDAGIALHHAKAQGRGRCALFTPRMGTEPRRVLWLQSDLRRTLENGGLHLDYQPVVDLQHRHLVGFEALARWNHPQHGPIPPSVFIPVAEDAGLMPLLGARVMRDAFARLAAWQRRLAPGHPLSLSINMAPSQLADPDLFATIDRLLAETGADPARIKIEVTETSLAGDAESAILRLKGLRERGLMIMIDDFGTGYSSLGRLHRFPIDGLKIDQSFVKPLLMDRDSATIVRSIVALGKALGLSVVGEGVEDEASARELARLGCDHAQGYHFAPPLPEAEADTLLGAGKDLTGMGLTGMGLTGMDRGAAD
ncbi:putative bifunctional diguanylate cyclase/phosphodiesterase [Arenibaculum sp.]|uniref:putative bifunctional diguanylate cyclase/phosphodiesterase n=1 Tax=Arenibaculum sp. TaxID=2865862 RepID=UPI002E143BBB|nr:EAL domain-containing protein [Arenibaculum sp.]